MEIQLAKPDITQAEIDAVVAVMESGVLSIGPKVEEFEKRIANYIGVKHAIAVNSGTSGLHLLIKALGIKKGDEVITTPFSFVASANCILFEGAKPVFVDIEPDTLNIDIERIEDRINEKTKAILAVDVFGHPVDIQRIRAIAQIYGLAVVEDSCEALGSEYSGVKCGSRADGAVFAFYPNKQITTGEGGIIVTNNDITAEYCRSCRSQGRAITGLWLLHERLGYNYRLSELHAALGVAQMQRIDEILDQRNAVAEMYNSKLKSIEGVRIPYIHPDVTRMSWFVYVIRLDPGIDRDTVMRYMLENGVGCRPYFTPIHLQPYFVDMFGYKQGDFPVAEQVAESTIALPFFNNLSEKQIEYTVAKLKEGINNAAAGKKVWRSYENQY
ncbi:MAG: DegT/DnrJ/EryC1/StrS family aminotransferase [Acetivibrionales bacterium]|jgi:perosamine synthetase